MKSLSPSNRATLVNKPIKQLRERARLGAVTVFPDLNRQVRRFACSEVLHGERYYTRLAILAGAKSSAYHRFVIDYSIDPRTIPRAPCRFSPVRSLRTRCTESGLLSVPLRLISDNRSPHRYIPF